MALPFIGSAVEGAGPEPIHRTGLSVPPMIGRSPDYWDMIKMRHCRELKKSVELDFTKGNITTTSQNSHQIFIDFRSEDARNEAMRIRKEMEGIFAWKQIQ